MFYGQNVIRCGMIDTALSCWQKYMEHFSLNITKQCEYFCTRHVHTTHTNQCDLDKSYLQMNSATHWRMLAIIHLAQVDYTKAFYIKLTCLSQLLIEPIFKMKLWSSGLHWFL